MQIERNQEHNKDRGVEITHDQSQKMDRLIEQVFSRRSMPDFDEVSHHRGSAGGSPKLMSALWNWVAAVIDTLLVIAFVMLVASVISSTPYWKLFYSVVEWVLFATAFAYTVLLRIITGHTVGEWACGLRLGTYMQRRSSFYSLKVVLRSLLIFSTGFFILPLLSLFLKKDLAGKIVGLELKSEN